MIAYQKGRFPSSRASVPPSSIKKTSNLCSKKSRVLLKVLQDLALSRRLFHPRFQIPNSKLISTNKRNYLFQNSWSDFGLVRVLKLPRRWVMIHTRTNKTNGARVHASTLETIHRFLWLKTYNLLVPA
jgi:hypothetical protein